MGLDELIRELRDLPPADLEKVIDFGGRLRKRQAADEGVRDNGHGEALLDQIASNPELKSRFNAMLDRAMADSEQGMGCLTSIRFARVASPEIVTRASDCLTNHVTHRRWPIRPPGAWWSRANDREAFGLR